MIAKVVLLYTYLNDYVNSFGGIFRDQAADHSCTVKINQGDKIVCNHFFCLLIGGILFCFFLYY